MNTTIEGKAILVTGANRGIGQALVTEVLTRGAAKFVIPLLLRKLADA